jgi:hypothetical protein
VISCWCDANAAEGARQIKELFPGVIVQPKGLLSTEGFVSFPLEGENPARLSAGSHFFEFISLTDGQIYLAHQLHPGKEYSVVITTSGGLYRYRLNDVIEVKGFAGKLPLMSFKGRQDRISDLFGEKLNEVFLKNALSALGINPRFCMIAPEKDRYVAYISADYLDKKTIDGKFTLQTRIDEALRENFHYDYCRKLGQLKELKIFRLTGDPEREYMAECVRRGQRLGDVKPALLHLQGSWDRAFKGEYL